MMNLRKLSVELRAFMYAAVLNSKYSIEPKLRIMKYCLLTTLLCILLPVPVLIHGQDTSSCEYNYGTYSYRAPIPVRTVAMASGVIDGKIYLATGYNVIKSPNNPDEDTAVVIDYLSVFDPETNTWDTTGARVPVPRYMHGAGNTVLDGKLYLIGGVDWAVVDEAFQPIPHARVDMYDPQSDTWELKNNLPIPLGGNGVCSMDGKLYVTGGLTTGNTSLSSFNSYDPVTGSWEELTEMTMPRVFHVSVALDGKIYVIGGDDTDGPGGGTRTCEIYDPDSGQWTPIAPLPKIILFAAACVVDGEIYVFGGYSDGIIDDGIIGDAYKYKPEEDTWIKIDPVDKPKRRDHAAVPIGRTIYLIGGRPPGRIIHNNVQKFELSDVCLDSFIPDDTINGDTIELDLSEHFSHVDGDKIIYSFCTDGSNIIDASINGSVLSITGLAIGDTEISILAESEEDNMGDLFHVTVASPTPTGIGENSEISPRLHIYPNPSIGMTILAYSVQSPGIVRIEVYDMLGKRVATPMDKYQVPGEYEYQLETGELEPGFYFCELTTVSQRVSVKLLVEH